MAITIRSKNLHGDQHFELTAAGLRILRVEAAEGRRLAHKYIKGLAKAAGRPVHAPTETEFVAWVLAEREAAQAKIRAKNAACAERRRARAERLAARLRRGRSAHVVRPIWSDRVIALASNDDDTDTVTYLSDGAGLWEVDEAPARMREIHERLGAGANSQTQVNDEFVDYRKLILSAEFRSLLDRARSEDGEALRLAGVLPSQNRYTEYPVIVFEGEFGRACLDSRLLGEVSDAKFYSAGTTAPIAVKRANGSLELLMPMRITDFTGFLPVTGSSEG